MIRSRNKISLRNYFKILSGSQLEKRYFLDFLMRKNINLILVRVRCMITMREQIKEKQILTPLKHLNIFIVRKID